MYKPIFNIKQAPVDADIILISPRGIEVISVLENNERVRYLAGDDRAWVQDTADEETTIMSPLIGLKRTEHIIKSILKTQDITYPIHKTVLSRKLISYSLLNLIIQVL